MNQELNYFPVLLSGLPILSSCSSTGENKAETEVISPNLLPVQISKPIHSYTHGFGDPREHLTMIAHVSA